VTRIIDGVGRKDIHQQSSITAVNTKVSVLCFVSLVQTRLTLMAVSISTTGSGTLEAGIRRAEVDTYGGTMSSLALRTKDTDSVKKAN